MLRIAFEGAAMHWEDGSVSLRHSRDAYERPFRAFSTDAGTIVVDVVTP